MTDTNRIPTNQRTMRILEVLGNSDRPLTPTEINSSLGLPKQTVHRLCTMLENEGFLIRETNGKRLQPARRLKLMASGILFNARSQVAARQVLLGIAHVTNETVNLVIPEESGMMYFDRVETDWPFRIQLPVGSHVPFHCTASGKTFLASLAPVRRKAMVESLNLKAHTPNTFTESDTLLKELAKIAKQGYAYDNEEFMEGMVAIAVPIKDGAGKYCGAVAFHGPTQRLSLELALSHRQTLFDGAKQLSETLFR